MADSKVEETEVTEECPLKDKKIEETNEEEVKDEKTTDVNKVENGDIKEKNGKQDAEEEKEICEKTACKRKSTGGGDAPDETPAEGTPEKKQKKDDTPKEEEAKTEEVTA